MSSLWSLPGGLDTRAVLLAAAGVVMGIGLTESTLAVIPAEAGPLGLCALLIASSVGMWHTRPFSALKHRISPRIVPALRAGYWATAAALSAATVATFAYRTVREPAPVVGVGAPQARRTPDLRSDSDAAWTSYSKTGDVGGLQHIQASCQSGGPDAATNCYRLARIEKAKLPDALFVGKAGVARGDETLHHLKVAADLYGRVATDFPNSNFADDAGAMRAALLLRLGRTDDAWKQFLAARSLGNRDAVTDEQVEIFARSVVSVLSESSLISPEATFPMLHASSEEVRVYANLLDEAGVSPTPTLTIAVRSTWTKEDIIRVAASALAGVTTDDERALRRSLDPSGRLEFSNAAILHYYKREQFDAAIEEADDLFRIVGRRDVDLSDVGYIGFRALTRRSDDEQLSTRDFAVARRFLGGVRVNPHDSTETAVTLGISSAHCARLYRDQYVRLRLAGTVKPAACSGALDDNVACFVEAAVETDIALAAGDVDRARRTLAASRRHKLRQILPYDADLMEDVLQDASGVGDPEFVSRRLAEFLQELTLQDVLDARKDQRVSGADTSGSNNFVTNGDSHLSTNAALQALWRAWKLTAVEDLQSRRTPLLMDVVSGRVRGEVLSAEPLIPQPVVRAFERYSVATDAAVLKRISSVSPRPWSNAPRHERILIQLARAEALLVGNALPDSTRTYLGVMRFAVPGLFDSYLLAYADDESAVPLLASRQPTPLAGCSIGSAKRARDPGVKRARDVLVGLGLCEASGD